MSRVDSEGQARQELERVLASPAFVRNERLSRFLRFTVERHLDGRDEELKESLIAIEVFGRPPGYDSKRDPIVRTEASRLRTKLTEYYLGEGKSDSLIIELPKGGYVPAFQSGAIGQIASPAPKFRRPLLIATALGCLLAVLGMAAWWWFHKNAPITIAVLPLENLGHDPANDYFADGLTDELIRKLSIIDGLSPRSRTSSFAFRGKGRNVREAGRELAADYILEGSVLRAGRQLRINTQLIRVRDDFPIWSGEFDRELTDVFAIQEEISRGIVNSLRLKLGRGRRRYETSTEAYDLYLQARALEGSKGIGAFEAVIAKDSSFAPAYAGLAGAYAFRSGTVGAEKDDLAKIRAAAEKAIQLDPLLAEAHAALGIAYAREGQWEQSEKSFHRSIELDPNRSGSYCDFVSYVLLVLGRLDEALQQLHVAEKADPLSPVVHNQLAYVLLSAGRYDEAAGHCRKLSADSRNGEERDVCLGRARLGQGRVGEAVQILFTAVNRGVSERAPIRGYLGYAYGRAGRREEAEQFAAAASQNPFQQALTFAGLGDKERTLEALERMAAFGPVRLGRDLTYPEFILIRGDPRVQALRKKVGLPQ